MPSTTKQRQVKKNAARGQTVEVIVDLGCDLKRRMLTEAKARGLSANEFVIDVIESTIARNHLYDPLRHEFVRHGGKHLSGKHTGYEVTEDGKYYPAPSWTARFDLLFSEREAIHSLINAVYNHAQARLVLVERALGEAKTQLLDDLGLDPEKQWIYHGEPRCYVAEAQPDKQEPK